MDAAKPDVVTVEKEITNLRKESSWKSYIR